MDWEKASSMFNIAAGIFLIGFVIGAAAGGGVTPE